MRQKEKSPPSGAGGLLGKFDLKRDCWINPPNSPVALPPQVIRLEIRPRGRGRFAVDLNPQTLVASSSDPEHASARELLRRGITGAAITVDSVTGQPQMRFSIEKFAATCTVETDAGLRIVKWTPPPSSRRPAKVNAPIKDAFIDPARSEDQAEEQNASLEAAL